MPLKQKQFCLTAESLAQAAGSAVVVESIGDDKALTLADKPANEL
jgi:hypothetical protein